MSKIGAYKLQQEEKLDTVDANLAIGEPEDARDYLVGALMLKHLKDRPAKTCDYNNPAKVGWLRKVRIEYSREGLLRDSTFKDNEYDIQRNQKKREQYII